MSLQNAVWSFRNEKTEKQVDGLSFKQAEFIFGMIPRNTRYTWLVWHEGLTDWQTLDECKFFKDDAPVESAKEAPAKEETKTKTKKTQKTQKTKPADNRRGNQRFKKRFKVVIEANGKAFKTYTVNLSMGGVLLENSLPPDFGKTFGVTLEHRDGSTVELFCSTIRVPDGSNSKRLKIIGSKQEGLFRTWLLDPSVG